MSRAIIVSAAYTAVGGNNIMADTSGAAFTIVLPTTSSLGDTISFGDAKLTWNTHPLTIGHGAGLINGSGSDFLANIVGLKLIATYISASYGWSVK